MFPAHNCGPPQRRSWTEFWRRFSTDNKTAAHKRRKEKSRYWRWRRVCPRRQAVLLNEKNDALRRTGYVSACPHIPLPHCLRWPGVYLSRRRRHSVHLMKIGEWTPENSDHPWRPTCYFKVYRERIDKQDGAFGFARKTCGKLWTTASHGFLIVLFLGFAVLLV